MAINRELIITNCGSFQTRMLGAELLDPAWLHRLDDRETTGPSRNDEMDIPYFGTVLPGLCRLMPSLLSENR
jgi:hypothetical protein